MAQHLCMNGAAHFKGPGSHWQMANKGDSSSAKEWSENKYESGPGDDQLGAQIEREGYVLVICALRLQALAEHHRWHEIWMCLSRSVLNKQSNKQTNK